MKKKFMLQVVAWLLTLAMLLPSAGATFTTAYAEEEKAAYTGSTTFTGSGNWTEHEMTKSEILGNVDPSKVTYIEFTGTTKFQTGYNDVKRGWTQNPDANKHVCDDIALDDWFAFKFGLANSDGKKCTVTWKVFTSAPKADKEPETPANVVHSGSATFSDSTWWTAYEIKDRAALIGDINPEDIAYVKFTSDTTFLIGYNNGPGYYQTPTEDPVKSWVADDINWDLSAYYLQLMLSKGDGREYTIKWDVVSKVAATPTPTPKPTATPTPTPIPKYTNVGETLTVTENMVKNGVVTIKNAQYDEIIVPAGLGITTINFNVIDVEKLVLEGGENYTVSLRNALVEETTVAASKVREMTIEELTAELDKVKDAKDAHAAISAIIDGFVASQKAQSDAAKAKVKLVARDSELGTIDVNTNVLVDVTDAVLKNLDVSTKDAIARMAVNVVGFDGRASVDLSNVALTLKFNDSALEALNVSGNESVLIEGSASIVETMTLSGVAFVSSNLDTTNLVVDEKNENADVRIYADVNNLIVEGEKNDIILPACASVDNAIVAGDNIRVYGLGVLTHAEVIGTGANVAVQETVVEGENDTSMPKEMMAMMPTAAPTPKPRPEAKKVEVVLDSSYAGDYQRSTKIPASAFEGLTGDVKVTVDFEFLSGYDVWRGFTFYEGDNKIYQPEKKMMTASETITESGRISLDKDKTEVTFTLNADGINHAKSKGISVQYAGVEISKMTFTDANNTVIEKTFAAPYKDWNTYEAILSGAEIGALKAPVTVKVNYTATASDGDKVILPHSDWLPFCAKGYDYYASPEVKTDYSVPYCLKEDGGININVKTINSATFTLTANAVKAIIENGTGIEAQIYGLYLTKATLVEAGTTTNKPANPTAPEEPEEENDAIHTFEWVEPVDDGNGGLKMDIPEFAFLIKDYLPDVQVKEKVKITVNLTGDVYFKGQIGANTYKEGAQYGEWTVFEQFESPTVLTGEIEVPHDYADVKIQMWWMDETEKGVTVDSITVQRVETSGGGNGSGTGYVAGPAYSGTHVFDPHQEYWLMEEIALADLFGPVNQSDATSVILYCADKNIGYQHGLADETFDQKAGGRYYNINADEIANYFQFIFNDSSATETTLYWEVYTEELIVGHEDSVTIDGVANEEWNAGETSITTLEGLLGEVPLEEAEFIIFECPVNMIVQYRAPGSQYPGFYGSTLVKMNLADVDFDFDDFFFKLGLNVRDAGTQTISWTVYTKATE